MVLPVANRGRGGDWLEIMRDNARDQRRSRLFVRLYDDFHLTVNVKRLKAAEHPNFFSVGPLAV